MFARPAWLLAALALLSCATTSAPSTSSPPAGGTAAASAGRTEATGSPIGATVAGPADAETTASPLVVEPNPKRSGPGLSAADCARQLPACRYPRPTWVQTRFGGAAPRPGEPTGFEQCVCDACTTDADCAAPARCASSPQDPCNPQQTPLRCVVLPAADGTSQAMRPCDQHRIPSRPPAPGREAPEGE